MVYKTQALINGNKIDYSVCTANCMDTAILTYPEHKFEYIGSSVWVYVNDKRLPKLSKTHYFFRKIYK